MKKTIIDKVKGPFDIVFIRTYLLLIAIFYFLVVLGLVSLTQTIEVWWGFVILVIIFLVGMYFLIIGVFSTSKYAESVANKTGNHEILFLFIILAGFISIVVRKFVNGNSTDTHTLK